MGLPTKVEIIEVGARDGLQNEAQILSTDLKIEFINKLATTGLATIEATSFVSPSWIPQLADASAVLTGIKPQTNVKFPVLVPNLRGFENALAAGAKVIAVFTAASETFSKKNTNSSIAESMQKITEIVAAAQQHKIMVRGYISCVLGCPYEGEVAANKVVSLAEQLYDLGCYQISLGDTIGVGTPLKTKNLFAEVATKVPQQILAGHFHDTYGQALANIYAVLEDGIAVFDSSVGGLGGCPYAPGASGNVATEDVVYMLNGMGIDTGVDLTKLIAVSKFIANKLNKESNSKVTQARN